MTTPKLSAKRVLVVDDEPFVCDAVKMMLAFDGHEVETAGTPREALALFEPGKYDVVITDFQMPMMRGNELAAAIRAKAPGQPIIMITAYAEMLQSSSELLANIDHVISKPFLLEHLREGLQKVLSPRRSTPDPKSS